MYRHSHSFKCSTKASEPPTVELREPPLREAPEVLDAVDVALAARELVLAVEHAVVLVSVEHETVIRLPAVRANRGMLKN